MSASSTTRPRRARSGPGPTSSPLGAKGEKISLLDDPRETIGVGHIINGTSVNSTDEAEIEAAAQVILDHVKDVSAFSYDVIPLVQSGDLAAAHWYVGANMYVSQMPDVLGYVIPEEGATMYQEDICVLESAPNKENAVKFLQFYLRPEIAALNVGAADERHPEHPGAGADPA